MRFARGTRRRHTPGQMNKLEAAYADHLRLLTHAGEVADFWFESWKWKLADKTYYTPDFVVQMPDGMLEAHEVKGFWEDDARVKVKVFADKYPIRVKCITARAKKHGGGWEVEEIRKDGAE